MDIAIWAPLWRSPLYSVSATCGGNDGDGDSDNTKQ